MWRPHARGDSGGALVDYEDADIRAVSECTEHCGSLVRRSAVGAISADSFDTSSAATIAEGNGLSSKQQLPTSEGDFPKLDSLRQRLEDTRTSTFDEINIEIHWKRENIVIGLYYTNVETLKFSACFNKRI